MLNSLIIQSVLIISLNLVGFKLLALMHAWELEPCKLKEISLILRLMMITTKIPGWPLERLRIKLSLSLLNKKKEEIFSVQQCHLSVQRKYGKS